MSSEDKSSKTLESVKLKSSRKWEIKAYKTNLANLLSGWAKERDIPDDFMKKHFEVFKSTLYQCNALDKEKAYILLDGLKQDIVGGSQTYGDKLWGYKLKQFIVVPNNKCVFTSVLLRNILKLTAMTKTPSQFSDVDLSETSDQNNFWSGFFSELYSESPLKRISPITDKTTMYAAGVACMRLELYNLIRKEHKKIAGQYWIDIDYSVIGNPNKKTKKYLLTFLSTYVNGSLLNKTLSQILANYYSAYKGQIVKRVTFESFLKGSKAVVASFNRHKIEKTTIGKGKKSKTITKKVIIKPTKPSRIATIFAAERASIAELCETAWDEMDVLLKTFDKTKPLERDYESFTTTVKDLIKKQWDAKQIVLNASRFRQGALDIDQNASTAKKILEMRKLTSLYEVPNKSLFRDFETLYVTLFSKLSLKTVTKFNVPDLDTFYHDKGLKNKYPITRKLIGDFLKFRPQSDNLRIEEREDSKDVK